MNRKFEKDRVTKFFKERLKNEELIKIPPKKDCRIVIVIPVFNELPRRIFKQLNSLTNQRSISFDNFEIIYVVNNGNISKKNNKKEGLSNNKKILTLPIWKNRNFNLKETEYKDHEILLTKIRKRLNIFVIDKSSAGKTFKDCTVGKVRNRGIAEACYRFYNNQENGILIQTDADAIFEDIFFLKNVSQIFEDDPDIIGVIGGISYIFDPDTENITERKKLIRKMKLFAKFRLIQVYSDFLKSNDIASAKKFTGANMISRSYETAVIGGLKDLKSHEDVEFTKALIEYAAANNKKVLVMKNSLKLITSARESTRTLSGEKFVRALREFKEPVFVEDPFSCSYEEFKNKFIKNRFDKAFFMSFFIDKNGNLLIPDKAYRNFLSCFKTQKIEINDNALQKCIKKYFENENIFFKYMYVKKYPQIMLTDELLLNIIPELLKTKKGAELYSRYKDFFKF